MDKNLEPTIKFYDDYVGSNAAIQLVVNRPRVFLGSSLESRLAPRLACHALVIQLVKQCDLSK